MYNRILLCLSLIFFSCTSSLNDKNQKPDASISIDLNNISGKVQNLVFGQNIEAADGYNIHYPNHNYEIGKTGDRLWDPVNRQPQSEVVAAALETGISILRYPGGCLVHNFDWHNAVGPS